MRESSAKQTLKAAAQALRQIKGLEVDLHLPATDARKGNDARVIVRHGEREINFTAAIKSNLNRSVAALAVEQLAGSKERALLVSNYVNPKLGELLREADVCFADTVGNVYINEPPLFIYITGNKPENYQRPTKATGRVFRTKGLQVVFALLCNPGLENEAFRRIADLSGVALGTVDRVIKELTASKFMRKQGRGRRRLFRRGDLLRRWVEAYPEQLEGKIVKGRYTAKDPNWWQDADILADGGLWGGEVAAAKLTGYLRPGSMKVYVKEAPGKLLVKNQLTKSPEGGIEILDRFWNFEFDWTHEDIAPPLLIYTNLMASGDPRNIETARIIYEEHLTRLVRED